MAIVRCTNNSLKEINKIVRKRRRGSALGHNQQSVIEDAVKALKEKEAK